MLIRSLALILSCFIGLMVSQNVQSQTLKVNSTAGMAQENYIVGALKLALSKSGKKYQLQETQERLSDTRIRADLATGAIAVYWSGTSNELESEFTPIRIPLFKGLMGHRIFIIRQGEQSQFDNIRSLNDLIKLDAGQGTHWPDTQVLKRGGVPVKTTLNYENLFYMLEGGRFDYYPRSVIEPWAEIVTYSHLNLTVENKLMLVYHAPFYFFVGKDNSALAKDIETGLEKAINDGSYDEFFFSHPIIKTVLTEANMKQRRIIRIDNPALPPQTPLSRSELWLNVKDL